MFPIKDGKEKSKTRRRGRTIVVVFFCVFLLFRSFECVYESRLIDRWYKKGRTKAPLFPLRSIPPFPPSSLACPILVHMHT